MRTRPLIILDMDGVITSEEGYWKAAACTVIELASRMGHPASQRAMAEPERLSAQLTIPHALISEMKGRSINTNWDLCFFAASLLLRELAGHGRDFAECLNECDWAADQLPSLSSWPAEVDADFGRLLKAFLALRLEGGGFALMLSLSDSMAGLDLRPGHFLRPGPVWEWCFQHFQVWFAGSDWDAASSRPQLSPARRGIMEEESLILPAEQIRGTLEDLRAAGWSLAIATGRTRRELLPTLSRFGLLPLFEQDRIVTHDEISAAEQTMGQLGHGAQFSKPSPFPFLRALLPTADTASLSFMVPPPLPAGTVIVGDTVGDMVPARLLQARGVAVLTGPGGAAAEPALRAAGARDVIPDLTALPALLGRA